MIDSRIKEYAETFTEDTINKLEKNLKEYFSETLKKKVSDTIMKNTAELETDVICLLNESIERINKEQELYIKKEEILTIKNIITQHELPLCCLVSAILSAMTGVIMGALFTIYYTGIH